MPLTVHLRLLTGKEYVQGDTNGEVNCAREGKPHDFEPFSASMVRDFVMP